MSDSRSPLRDKPLRNPGQSLDERRVDILQDDLLQPLLIALFLVALAALEWVWYLNPVRPVPWLYTAIALAALVYAAVRVRKGLRKARAVRLGLEGERAVGQFLEHLRADGYQVFHDLVGDGFNVDHVLIGPSGVHTIETKTWNKPGGKDAKVLFDGTRIRVDGLDLDRDPVIQAKAQASWLRELLEQSTGQKIPVHPVILFPGWFVEQEGEVSKKEVWVLNPRALKPFLDHEPERLTPERVRLAAFHLGRFIRAGERQPR